MRNDFVKSTSSLLLPTPLGAFLGCKGIYKAQHIRNGEVIDEFDFANIVVNQGLNHILAVQFTGVTQIVSWYLAPFEGNYVPVAADTAATIVANATENTTYASSTRVLYSGTVGSQQVTNSGSTALFTFNATKTIYGAFMISSSAKSSTSGTLFSAAQFSAPKTVADTDQLLLTYTFVASSI